MNDINNTIEYKTGRNYKQRFKEEYQQLLMRRNKLSKLINDYQRGTLKFLPDTPINLLMTQCAIMDAYLFVLKQRALIENIELY